LIIITYPKSNLIQWWKAKIWLPKFLPYCHPKTHSFKPIYSFYFSANQAIIMQLISKFTRTIIPPKYLHEPYNFKVGGFLLLMQEQERKTKLLQGMFLTFTTLAYLSEFLQKSTKIMSSSSNFQLLLSSSMTL